MKQLIIIGAGGFGKEVAWLAECINNKTPTWDIVGFLDDNPDMHGKIINELPVLGGVEKVAEYRDAYFVCTVGASKIRRKIIEKAERINPDIRYATLIHPSVEMSRFVKIAEGSVICAHNILTVNIEIGRHVIINLDCTVGHDVILEDYVTMYPSVNISGGVHTGQNVELGTGAQVLQYKTIGADSIIGAGSVVIKDIPARCTAVGIPAKPIKFFE